MTDLTNVDLNAVASLTVKNANGQVAYPSATTPYDLVTASGGPVDLDTNLSITSGTISLNSIAQPQLNRPATLSFFNVSIPPATLQILRDSSICATCSIVSYVSNTLVISVPGFSTYSIISDVTPPTVSVTSPTNGSSATAGNIALSANAADNVAVSNVSFWVDGAQVGSTNVSPYTLTWNAAAGTHSIFAVANDEALNYATSSSVTVTVSAAVTSGGTGSSGSGGGTGGGGGSSGGGGGGGGGINTVPTTCTTTSALPAYVSTLAIGSRSTNVSDLQTFLVIQGYLQSQYVTGYFGPLTQAALASYKAAHPNTCTTTTTGRYTFQRTLRIGSSGADVQQLQIFLNTHGFAVSASGNGSRGHETSYYGPATAAAVSRFQVAHASDILAPIGLTQGTGNFGAGTMRVVNGTY